MATYDLSQTQLDAALTHNFDARTRDAIIDYLNDAHAFDPKVTVDNEPFPANSSADVFSVQSTFAVINTDDPPKVILANTAQNVTRDIVGHHDVLVATGPGNDQILLNDSGNDVVYAGAGNAMTWSMPAPAMMSWSAAMAWTRSTGKAATTC